MHGNRSEIEEIFEKTLGLCIHFFYIIERTLGDSPVEKRDLFYPPYPLVGDNKKIKFIIGPGNIEKEEIYRPIYDEK